MLEYLTPAHEQTRRGKGFIAVCGTILCPGLGHFIIARPRRSAGWIAFLLCLFAAALTALWFPVLAPALILLVPASAIGLVACMIDAYLCGRNLTGNLLNGPPLRYIVGGFMVFLAMFLHPESYVAMMINEHVAEGFQIMTPNAMAPTITDEDQMIRHHHIWLSRGSVVVVRFDDGYELALRLVGLPGDKVEIVSSTLYVNEKPVASPPGVTYTSLNPYNKSLNTPGCQGNPIKLGSDECYCLADKSSEAPDSRSWQESGHQPGAIALNRIIGIISCIYWPPKRWKKL
ncbi:MAG TPA: signal peptidase I [Tepidisphaeraceae bacterium]|jgi:signal peptidase I|nr:signal peptidase I [Tepidisphaeraceae bacterium]